MAKIFMSETRKNLLLFTFLLRIYFSFGSSLKMSDLSPYALLNQPFTFTCIATEAAELEDLIKFFKEETLNPMGVLRQTTTHCTLFSNSEGYVASCGSHSNSASTKYYTLTISNTTDRDDANWWCELDSAGTRSDLANLQIGSSPLKLSNLSPYALLNQPFTFTCTVTEAANLEDRIRFFKEGEANPVGVLRQTITGCALFNNSEGYVASCGSHSNSDSTKYYTLTISNTTDRDADYWWCEFNSDGKCSNLVNLQIIDVTPVLDTTTVTDSTRVRGRPKSGTWCIRCHVLNSVIIVGGFIISF